MAAPPLRARQNGSDSPKSPANKARQHGPPHSEATEKDKHSRDTLGLLPSVEMKIEKVAHWAWSTIPFEKLPHWLRDNEYLHHSHRPPMYSFTGCFKSMFRLHTETWNIWTHFAGFVFFVVLSLGAYVFGDYITFLFDDIEISKLPWDEQLALFFFFLGAMACMYCSFMFHLVSNHSHEVYKIFSKLDYSGIAFLITGSSIPAYYYAFYCTTTEKYIHIAVLVALCATCIAVSFGKKFATPAYRPLRFSTFVLFGLYGIIPGIHVMLLEDFEFSTANEAYSIWGLCSMGAMYIGGACLYVFRVPERFYPGKFDVWASSHQLFHVCVLAAALVHYDSLLNMVKYRLTAQCGISV